MLSSKRSSARIVMTSVFTSFLLLLGAFSVPLAHAATITDEPLAVTDGAMGAGSADDNAYINWNATGADPIFPDDPDADPILTTYFAVSVMSQDATTTAFALCSSPDTSVGIRDLANDETSDTKCRIKNLQVGASYDITVTPYAPGQEDGQSTTTGEPLTITYTPSVSPGAPVVSATVDTASDTITVSWAAGKNPEVVTGWFVDADGAIADGSGNCINWTESQDENGQDIQIDSGIPLTPETTSCSFSTELFKSTEEYTVSVIPQYGDGEYSGKPGYTFIGDPTAADPGVLTSFEVTASGPKSAQVTWASKKMTGAPATSDVTVTTMDPEDPEAVTPECADVALSAKSCTLAGLDNGKTYQVIVSLENDNGAIDSSDFNWSYYRQPTVPRAPRNFTVVDTGSNLEFNWDAPYNGGAPLNGYSVVNVATNQVVCADIAVTDTTCAYTGADLGSSKVQFGLRATNLVGDGTRANASFTPLIPSAVTNIAISVSGPNSAMITWPRADNATGYVVKMNGNEIDCPPAIGNGTPGCEALGLVQGRSYDVTVDAVRWNATTPSQVQKYTQPSPPVVAALLQSVAPDGRSAMVQVTVDGLAPVNGTKANIDVYDLKDDTSVFLTSSICAADVCKVDGLLPGGKYRFDVTARNGAGSSDVQSVIVRTPSTLRAPGGIVVVAQSKNKAFVGWRPVAGAARFVVVVTSVSGTQTYSDVTTLSQTIDVTAGTTYSVTIASVNSVGIGEASIPVSYTHPLPPKSPRNISVYMRSNAAASVQWDAGDSTVNGYASGYFVNIYSSNKTLVDSCTTGFTLACDVSGMQMDTYDIQVFARNVSGDSPIVHVPFTPPGKPSAPIVSAVPLRGFEYGAVRIRWSVLDSGNSPLSPAQITLSRDGQPVQIPVFNFICPNMYGDFFLDIPKNQCTISGLTPGALYTVSVKVSNDFGSSTGSQDFVIPEIPETPKNLFASALDATRAKIAWSPAKDASSYKVSVTGGSGIVGCADGAVVSQPTCVLTGLSAGKSYTINVVAQSSFAPDSPATNITWLQPTPPPQVPVGQFGGLVSSDGSFTTLNYSYNSQITTGTPIGIFLQAYVPGSTSGTPICGGAVFSDSNIFCALTTPLPQGTIVSGYATWTPPIIFGTLRARGLRSIDIPIETLPILDVVPIPPAPVSGLVAFRETATSAKATWNADVDPSTKYTFFVNGAIVSGCANITATECTFGVTPGSQVTISVIASNDAGDSPRAYSAYFAEALPNAPFVLSYSATGISSNFISWNSNGNGSNVYYSVSIDGVAYKSCQNVDSTYCTVTGLEGGKSYLVTVTASTAAGDVPTSETFTQPNVAAQPTVEYSLSQDSRTATLRWYTSSLGGSLLKNIKVSFTPYQGVSGCDNVDYMTGTCELTGLDLNTSYTFGVRYQTALGLSPIGIASFTTGALPVTPNEISISKVSSNQVQISWDADAQTDSYNVLINGVQNADCSTAANYCTTTVESGRSVQVAVAGVNPHGTGKYGKAFMRQTAGFGAPILIAAPTADGRSIVVTYSSDLRARLQRLTVTPSVGQTGCASLDALEGTCTITGTTPGISYQLELATNDSRSVRTASTVSVATPKQHSAVTGLAATVIDKKPTLVWTPSTVPGVSYSVLLNGKPVKCAIITSAPSCLLGKLTPTTKYKVVVVTKLGVNQVSSKALKFSGKDLKLGALLTAKVTAKNTTLQWKDAITTPIKSIKVTLTPSVKACSGLTPKTTKCVVTGLKPGTKYTATVTIAHLPGLVAKKKVAATTTVTKRDFVTLGAASAPAKPLWSYVTLDESAHGSVHIVPAVIGAPATSYKCSASDAKISIQYTAATKTCDFTGATAGSTVTFKVSATGTSGTSPAQDVTWTAPVAPAKVTRLEATLTAQGNAVLSWLPDGDTANSLTGISITSAKSTPVTVSPTSTEATITLPTLDPGESVTFTVTPIGILGSGRSETVSITKRALSPAVDAADIEYQWLGTDTLDLSWKYVQSDVTYLVSDNTNGHSIVCITAVPQCRITGVTSDSLQLTIAIGNPSGWGPTTSVTINRP